MPIEKQDIQQMVAAASGYKFEDVERQKQYERLLADLNLIVEKYTFDQIWDDVGLLESFKQKIDTIMVLIEADKVEKEQIEKSVVWTREECIEWAGKVGVLDSTSYVTNNFFIFKNRIEVKGNIDLTYNRIRNLPKGLSLISGSLLLSGSYLRGIPLTLLEIGGDLDLRGSQIWDINESLEIGGNVFATGCSENVINKLKRMKKVGNIKGRLRVL